MLKKLATVFLAAAFGLAIYSPSADACPGAEHDSQVAKKDKDKKDDKKVADKSKAKKDTKKTKKAKKAKKKDGKKVSRR